MDIDKIPFKKLKQEYKALLFELGRLKASKNYCDKFKTNTLAQRDSIVLKDNIKHLENIKKIMEVRLRRGW